MKIGKITVENFMGLEGKYVFDLGHFQALVGKNGIGKTTLLNAIRFALTGLEPDGCDIINKKSEECSVSIELSDGNVYTRIKKKGSPSKTKINGKATSISSMNERMEDVIGIRMDTVKLVSSEEVILKQKPQELSDFILSYIPAEMNTEMIESLIPELTQGMRDNLDNALPVGKFGLKAIEEAEVFFREQRKSVNDKGKVLKAQIVNAPDKNPEYDRKTLERQLQDVIASEQTYRIELAKKQAYDTAVANRKKYDVQIQDLEKQVSQIDCETKPDGERKKLVTEKESCESSMQNASTVFSSLSSASKALKTSLDNLNKDYCPLSDKIKCTVDKTPVKKELEESIKKNIAAMKVQQTEYNKLKEKRKRLIEKIEEYDAAVKLLEKKQFLISQLEKMKKNYPDLPEKPRDIKNTTTESLKKQIQTKLNSLDAWERAVEVKKELNHLAEQFKDYDALVKALEPKGIVKNKIVSKYLQLFQDNCNAKAAEIKAGMKFCFQNDKGVHVLCDSGNGSYLKYNELSGGEKAYMIYILMDMFNTLSGTRFMFLDELSILDSDTFSSLVRILKKNQKSYDHIIIACVDHTDSIETIKNAGIECINIEECNVGTCN